MENITFDNIIINSIDTSEIINISNRLDIDIENKSESSNAPKWQAKQSSDFFINNDDKKYAQQFSQVAAVSNSTKSENSPLNKRVFHQKFGYGKVISVDGNKFEIGFEKTGKKTVIKDFVTFA